MAKNSKQGSSISKPRVGKSQSLPPLYKNSDFERRAAAASQQALPPEVYRSEFRRDYARLIHSSAFRRLQGKAQLFPCQENDFFRNRMSHSLEVAQIAKSIAIKINDEHSYFEKNSISTELIEFAGLAHDIGHPPFGHNGEAELDKHMLEYGGFEGNAQTLRILSRLEKKQTETFPHNDSNPAQVKNGKDVRLGLNLTYRALAAILKYDKTIPRNTDERRKTGSEKKPTKGYCWEETSLVGEIKSKVVSPDFQGKMKTIECSIMDVADDIAYSTYDLEDAFKGGFLSPLSIIAMPDDVKSRIVKKVKSRIDENYSELSEKERSFTLREYNITLRAIFSGVLNVPLPSELFDADNNADADEYNAALVALTSAASDDICRNGYLRTEFTSSLVSRFIRAVHIHDFNETYPVLSSVRMDIAEFIAVEVLKTLAFDAVIMSSRLKSAENRGQWTVAQVFKELQEDDGYLLMPEDWRHLVEQNSGDTNWKMRTICDYVAGMTDAYCIEFYERILGHAAPSIQKTY